MPEEELDVTAAEGEEEGEKKKSPLKLIIIIVAALAILGAGGYFAMDMFMGEDETTAAEGGADAEQAAADEEPLTVLALEPFIVNLADPSGKRYLKLALTIDCKNEETKQMLENRMPKIRDSILLLLTSKEYSQIYPVDGKIRLRNEVLQKINAALGGTGEVHAVYFTEFVIQ